LLSTLGVDPVADPMLAVYAVVQGQYVHVRVQVLALDGTEAVERSADLPITTHVDAAVDLAAELREAGAAALIDRAREEAESGAGAGG
jgi:hydroxymethylbilane synthase